MGRLKTQRTKEILQARKIAKREADQIKEGDKVLKSLETEMAKPKTKVVTFKPDQITVRRNIPQKIG